MLHGRGQVEYLHIASNCTERLEQVWFKESHTYHKEVLWKDFSGVPFPRRAEPKIQVQS